MSDWLKDKGVYLFQVDTIPRVYIGSTTISFKKRFQQHGLSLRNNKHHNTWLNNIPLSFIKAFPLHIVAKKEATEDLIVNLEMYYMSHFPLIKLFNSVCQQPDASKVEFYIDINKSKIENNIFFLDKCLNNQLSYEVFGKPINLSSC
jgi:hypothetical protein